MTAQAEVDRRTRHVPLRVVPPKMPTPETGPYDQQRFGDGDVVPMTVTLTNDGSERVDGITVTGTEWQPGVPLTLVCAASTLAPAESTTCSTSYTVPAGTTQTRGSLNWQLTIAGVAEDGAPYGGMGSLSVALGPYTYSVKVIDGSVVDDDGDGVAKVGDTLTYTYTVQSLAGPLNQVNLRQWLLDHDPAVWQDVSCSQLSGTGATATCTGTHVVTADDMAAAGAEGIHTRACANGNNVFALPTNPTPCNAHDPNAPSSFNLVMPTVADPPLALVKSGTVRDTNANGITDAGDTIAYKFDVTATTTVTEVLIADRMLAVAGVPVSCPFTSLAKGETRTCTASYVIPAGTPAGTISNTASVTGILANGDVTEPVSSTFDVPVAAPPVDPAPTPSESAPPSPGPTVTVTVTAPLRR